MKIILSIIIWFFILNVSALVQSEFVEQLKNTHPFFQQQNLSTQIKQVEKRATTADEDWILALKSSYENQDSSALSSSTYDNLDTASIQTSLRRKFFNSGSNISLNHTWIDKNKDFNSSQNTFSIDYIYPLLRNKNGVNDRLANDLAQIAVEQDVLERLELEEGFILTQLKRFIDLNSAQHIQKINQNRLNLARQELNLVRDKFAASVVDKVDVLSQEDAYQNAQQALLQAQQDLTLLRYELAITLGLDFSKVVAFDSLYKTYLFEKIPLKKWLPKHSRVLKITDFNQKKLIRQLRSFKNESNAKLDLGLGLSRAGESANYSDSLNNQSTTWNVGLQMTYPLGKVKNTSNIDKARAELERLEGFWQQQLLEVFSQATVFREKIDLLTKILSSNKKQISIAKARALEEKNRYANGNGQASLVISAQNNTQNAQLNYVRTATNYQKSVLEYRAILDKLYVY